MTPRQRIQQVVQMADSVSESARRWQQGLESLVELQVIIDDMDKCATYGDEYVVMRLQLRAKEQASKACVDKRWQALVSDTAEMDRILKGGE